MRWGGFPVEYETWNRWTDTDGFRYTFLSHCFETDTWRAKVFWYFIMKMVKRVHCAWCLNFLLLLDHHNRHFQTLGCAAVHGNQGVDCVFGHFQRLLRHNVWVFCTQRWEYRTIQMKLVHRRKNWIFIKVESTKNNLTRQTRIPLRKENAKATLQRMRTLLFMENVVRFTIALLKTIKHSVLDANIEQCSRPHTHTQTHWTGCNVFIGNTFRTFVAANERRH